MMAFSILLQVRNVVCGAAFAAAQIGSHAQGALLTPWNGGEGCYWQPANSANSSRHASWQCDFHDYLAVADQTDYAALAADAAHTNAGMLAIDAMIAAEGNIVGGENLAATSDVPEYDAADYGDAAGDHLGDTDDEKTSLSSYDWRAESACGPTDWQAEANDREFDVPKALPSPFGPLGIAQAAIGLFPNYSVGAHVKSLVQAGLPGCGPLPQLSEEQSEAAVLAACGAAQAAMRTFAARASDVCMNLGRQMCGLGAAIERLAESPKADSEMPVTILHKVGPQPSANPFSHLGL